MRMRVSSRTGWPERVATTISPSPGSRPRSGRAGYTKEGLDRVGRRSHYAAVPMPMPLQTFFVSASATSRASAERIYAGLQARGLVRPNVQFQPPDLDAREMATVLLSALGLARVIETPPLAEAFARCEYISSPGAGADQGPRMGPGSVLDAVTRMIQAGERFAVAFDAGRLQELWAAGQRQALPSSVHFRVNPLTVELVWHDRTDVYTPPRQAVVSAEPPPWAGGAIDHVAIVPSAVFNAAGRAWLELRRRHERKLSFNRVPAAPSGGPETQNAEALAGASASNCDRENARPGSLNSRGCKERLRPAQASPVRRHGRST